MTKPREFWIDVDELPHYYVHSDISQAKTNSIHVREVVPIDWSLIFTDYWLQTQAMDNLELIKELVEEQLAGEE